jgi:hypothetical protein
MPSSLRRSALLCRRQRLGRPARKGRAPLSGIVVAYAVTHNFATAVINTRQDNEKLPERLTLKGRRPEARAALAALRHIYRTALQQRLLPPSPRRKGWITQWDLRRMGEGDVPLISGASPATKRQELSRQRRRFCPAPDHAGMGARPVRRDGTHPRT